MVDLNVDNSNFFFKNEIVEFSPHNTGDIGIKASVAVESCARLLNFFAAMNAREIVPSILGQYLNNPGFVDKTFLCIYPVKDGPFEIIVLRGRDKNLLEVY